MLPLLVQLVPAVLQKLVASFQPPIVSNAIFAHSVQGQCCAMLNQLCQKLPAEQLLPHANDMMQGFLHVFNSKAAEVWLALMLTLGPNPEILTLPSTLPTTLLGAFGLAVPTLSHKKHPGLEQKQANRDSSKISYTDPCFSTPIAPDCTPLSREGCEIPSHN